MASTEIEDLLERLNGKAKGAALHHDKPANIVDDIREILDCLASDELPAASAVFLDAEPPGALYHLELVREIGKPSTEVNAGRCKLLELIASYVARIGAAAAEPYAKEIQRACVRTFRTELGTQKSVKAASLVPLVALFKLGLPTLTRAETRDVACLLREDYEKGRGNTDKVKANELEAIAALHDALPQPGPLSVERDPAEVEKAATARDVKKAPTPEWLLRVGLSTLGQSEGSYLLVAEGLDAVSSALAALAAAAAAAEEEEDDEGEEDDGNARAAAASGAANAALDRDTRKNVSEAVLASLALPSAGQRSDKTQAALSLLARHADALTPPPGVMSRASEYFHALLKCRTSSNKAIRQLAVPALDEFLRALSDVLSDDASADVSEREATLSRLTGEVMAVIDSRDAKNKEITTAVRAMGKLVRAAVAIGSQAANDLDLMMEKLAKLMMADAFARGGNDFDKRFEATERQAVMLATYTDLISLQPAGTPVQESALDVVVDVARWVWEHYHVSGDRMQLQIHGALYELFKELHARGGTTLLSGVWSRLARPLLALTLRVAPPDEIDSAFLNAAPEPIWPKYVSLWTHVLGGDGSAVPHAPAPDNRSVRERRKSGGGGNGGNAGKKERRRTRSLSIESSGPSETSQGISGALGAHPSTEEAHAAVAYDAFIDEVLQLCNTLELRVVPARAASGEDAEEAGAGAGAGVGAGADATGMPPEALALELGEGVAAVNPGDMQTFLCLVDLACAVIAAAPAGAIARWIVPLTDHLSSLAAAHPLLSGFYKIARAALCAANDSDVFDGDKRNGATEACKVFLREVLAGAGRQTDELRAAALQLLLSAPASLLSPRELSSSLVDALHLGLHHTPLAESALGALEDWTSRQGDDKSEIDAVLPSLVKALRPYVDRSPSSAEGGVGGVSGGDFDGDVPGVDGAGAAYRAGRVAAKRAHAADIAEAGTEGSGEGVSARVVRLLGAVGGAAHALAGEHAAGGEASLWDPQRRVSIDIVVSGGPGNRTVRLTLWLDAMLPRAASLALTSADRPTKVAASEFLHAATLLMIGRNARRAAPKGGDYAREPTPFHRVYKNLFPVIIDLAVDPEPVTRQLFSALAYQLVRWFTRNQAREAAETVALLDAVTRGLAGPSSASQGDDRGGVGGGLAASRRELCAALAAECLRWSVKHLPAESGGGQDKHGGAAVNVKSILRRLYAFQTHPEPTKRLGASVALQRCLTELRQHPALMEAHALEILEVTLRSLRLAEGDPPRAGAEEAGALLARAATRACARHATALCREPPSGGTARGGSFGTLLPLVEWIFTHGTARVETRARLESQAAFSALVQRLPNFLSPSKWLAETRAASRGASDGWPFRVTAEPPTPAALARVAESPDEDVAAATAWMRSTRAVLHWARWALERDVASLADVAMSGDDGGDLRHPLIAAGFFLANGVPALLSEEDDVDDVVAGSHAVRDWRRARVKLAVQVMVLAQHVFERKEENLDGFLKAIGCVVADTGGFARLLCLAVLSPASLGADTTGGRLDDVNELAGAAARVLKPMVSGGGAANAAAAAAIAAAKASMHTLLSSRGERYDLGSADLSTARGLTSARRLSAGYRALANVNLLRELLPTEGPASRGQLARRLLVAARGLGSNASPAQRATGRSLLIIAMHIGVPAKFIIALVLGDAMSDGAGSSESVVDGGGGSRRSAKDARRAEAAGEAFLCNFPKDIAGAVKWNFANYVSALVDRVVAPSGTPGSVGKVAALRLLSSALDPPAKTPSFLEASVRGGPGDVLRAALPHLHRLASMAERDSDDASQMSIGGAGGVGEESSLVRRQRVFIGLAKRALALDAVCVAAGGGKKTSSVLFNAASGEDTNTAPGVILAEAVGRVICPKSAVDRDDVVVLTHEVGPAQREALSLLPLLVDAGGAAASAAASAAGRLAKRSRDAGGASAPKGSPEGAAHATVLELLLDAFAKTRSPRLLAAVVAVVAEDDDGGSDAVARALGNGPASARGGDASPDEALIDATWTFAMDATRSPPERVVAGVALLPLLLRDAPRAFAGEFFARRAGEIIARVDPSSATNADSRGPHASVASAHVAYASLLAMYEKLDKDAVASGPGARVPKFNAVASRFLVAEIDGVGVVAAAEAEAGKDVRAWRERNTAGALDAMDVDGEMRGAFDPKPALVAKESATRVRQTAFAAFSALLIRTQTKAKFYEKLLEGGAKRWNALVDASAPVLLDVETKLSTTRSTRRRRAASVGDESRDGGDAAAPSLPFTLSATLAASDATLAPPPPAAAPAPSAGGDASAVEDASTADGGGGGDGGDEDLDDLESHPVCKSIFAALEHASRGAVDDVGGVARRAANLVTDGDVTPFARLLVAKSILRLHRSEIAAAEAYAAAKAAAERAAEEAAAEEAAAAGNEEDPELEVLAEKSSSEIEKEKLELAKAQGDFFEIDVSQRATSTRSGGGGADAIDDDDDGPAAAPPKTLLETHAAVLLPALMRGVVDVSRRVGCAFLHATLRETAVATLECARASTMTQEDDDALVELTSHVVSSSPSRAPFVLTQNIALAVKLARRTMDAALDKARKRGEDAPTALDAVAASALAPTLSAIVKLVAVDDTLARSEEGRAMRSCGVQMFGALALVGTLDLGGEFVAVRHAGEEDSPGCVLPECDARRVCVGVTTCLMEPGTSSGKPLHAAAASLLGVALAQGAKSREREMDVDAEGPPVDADADADAEPEWKKRLRRRLKKLYDLGPQDAFVAACERIARKNPRWLLENDASLVAQLDALLPRVHGEPRFVALTALSHVARCDARASVSFAERTLRHLPALLAARDAQTHALTLRSLTATLPGLAAEAARWPNGKKIDASAWSEGVKRVEDALWASSDASVKDAHAELCVAVAAAVPSLADHASVRAPLSRALGRDVGETAAAVASRAAVLAHLHARLPGGDASSGGAGGAAAGNLGKRLCAALRELPTAPESASASAAAATASTWLAAACGVVLAVPRSGDAYRDAMCEDDLMECEFHDAEVDTAWEGASLPMLPLFATQLNASQSAQSSLGVGGGAAATFASLERPSLASSTRVSSAASLKSKRRAPGMVMATPAPGMFGDTFSTQFGSSTLSTDPSGGGGGGGGGSLGVGATQAGLPSWLRRNAMSTQGGETIFDAGGGAMLHAGNLPRRRVLGVAAESASRGASAARGGGKSVSWNVPSHDDAAASYHSAAERRRRAERERARRRKHAVTLVRKYRAGELPDVKSVTPAALLDPLAALSTRDASTASSLISALTRAALTADDAAAEASERERAAAAAAAAEGGKKRARAAPAATAAEGPLRKEIRAAVAALLPETSLDQTLASWALDAVASDPGAGVDPNVVRAAAFNGGCLAAGIVALEARALHDAAVATERDADDAADDDAAAKKKKPRGASASVEPVPDALWSALAGLHRAYGDDGASRLCSRGALANHPRTTAALEAQLENDAGAASKIYDALLDDGLAGGDSEGGGAQRRMWEREQLRCYQRLGEWSEVADIVWESEWERTLDDAAAGVGLAGACTVAGLRPSEDVDERAIAGAAAGGGKLGAAIRAMLRLDKTTALKNVVGDGQGRELVEEEFGVEIAAARLLDGAEDAAIAQIASARRTFRARWLGTHPAATSARKALLQPLQVATELEEAAAAARLARARRVGALGGSRGRRASADARADADAGGADELELRSLAPLRDLLRRWRDRWPSDSLDPPEVWERVAAMREIGLRAFDRLAPTEAARSRGAIELLQRDEGERLLRAAKGLTRAGERNLALEYLRRAKDICVKRAHDELAPAGEVWKFHKTVHKVFLAAAEAPGQFSVDGVRELPEARNAALLNKSLTTILGFQKKGDLDVYPAEAAEAATIAGRFAAALAPLASYLPDGASSSAGGDANALSALAIDNFANAVALATQSDGARGAAKASLRLAMHCDDVLRAKESNDDRDDGRDAIDARFRGDETGALHPGGLEPSLVRHALLALAGGAARVPKARHLIPRVLALLREDDCDAAAAEFKRLVHDVPSWLFLEWVPQTLSLLDVPGPGGDAIVPLLESLAREYPSAMHADFHLSRGSFGDVGAARSVALSRALRSPARSQFARAVDLLDFPTQRLAWWRGHLKLLAAQGASDDAMFAAADALVSDVADPSEANLGDLNARFAQLAKGPLLRAIGAVGTRAANATSWLPRAIVKAELEVSERWRKGGFARAEMHPRQRAAQFSRWFGSFEPPLVTSVSSSSAVSSSSSTLYRHGVEVPGQYDALVVPPLPNSHAQIVGFEPEVDVFASKQRPKKLIARGGDGREYAFIAKGSEDLRQDDRIQRLFRAMDALLASSPAARSKALRVRTFHVAPLSTRCGLLEFVGGTVPLLHALTSSTKRAQLHSEAHQVWIKERATARDDGEGEDDVADARGMLRRREGGGRGVVKQKKTDGGVSADDYLAAMARTPAPEAARALESLSRRAAAEASPGGEQRPPESPALRTTLMNAAGSPDAFLSLRRTYASSLAATSVCGWVAGVGDRHLQNILLDLTDGSLVHIDFGYAFGTATAVLPIPELVPFRATGALLGGLAPNDAKTALRGDMTAAMHALRRGSALLRGVMDVFLREPLIDWQREARQVRVKAGKRVVGDEDASDDAGGSNADAGVVATKAVAGASGLAGDEGAHVELKIAHAWAKLDLCDPAAVTLAQCAAKHEGSSHWDGMREMVVIAGGGGTQDGKACGSVEEQVERLLRLATDPLVLATSWSGWRPWL